jgi:SAM-dependent methyltransferase
MILGILSGGQLESLPPESYLLVKLFHLLFFVESIPDWKPFLQNSIKSPSNRTLISESIATTPERDSKHSFSPSTAEYLAVVSTAYTHRADNSYDSHPFHTAVIPEYLQYCKLRTSTKAETPRILDLACGTGSLTLTLARLYPQAEVIGVDISPGMLAVARQNASGEGLANVMFYEHDILSLDSLPAVNKDLEKYPFDLVTCCTAVSLMPDLRTALHGFSRMMSPRGKLVFDLPGAGTPVPFCILTEVAMRLGLPVTWDPSWIEGGAKYGPFAGKGKMPEDWLMEVAASYTGTSRPRVHTIKDYGTRELKVEEQEKILNGVLHGDMGAIMGIFKKEEIRDDVKRLWKQEFLKMAGDKGVIREEIRLYVCEVED